jgi:hypothetical protein
MSTDKVNIDWGMARFMTAVVAAATALYVAGCCLPATDIGSLDGGALSDYPSEHQPTIGWAHLAFGWFDFPRSLPAWSANFVLVAGMIYALRGRRGLAAALGILATVLGLTTLFSYKHDGRYIGFYFWQGSQVVFAAGAIVGWVLVRRCEKPSHQSLQMTGVALTGCQTSPDARCSHG